MLTSAEHVTPSPATAAPLEDLGSAGESVMASNRGLLPEPRRLMVCGSRSWQSYSLVRGWMFTLRPALVIHGGALGADTIADEIAEELGVRKLIYRPDYDTFGTSAPHVRNDQMLDQADFVLAFWDGESSGTRSVIEKAKKRGIPHKVVMSGI